MQKSARSFPFSFILPSPCLPITSFHPLLLAPVFPLKSPPPPPPARPQPPTHQYFQVFLSLFSTLWSLLYNFVFLSSAASPTSMLIFFIFVLTLAVVILASTRCAYFESTKVTPSAWKAYTSSWPEYTIVSPVDSLTSRTVSVCYHTDQAGIPCSCSSLQLPVLPSLLRTLCGCSRWRSWWLSWSSEGRSG